MRFASRGVMCCGFALLLCGASVLPRPVGAQAAPAAVPATAAETALLASEQKRFDAQVAHDATALAPLIADDAVYIHATGQTQGKAEYLHDVEAGNSKYRSIEVMERTAHIYGRMGMVHGMLTLNVGVDRKIVARYTGVYVERDGRWQVLSFQTTPMTQRQ